MATKKKKTEPDVKPDVDEELVSLEYIGDAEPLKVFTGIGSRRWMKKGEILEEPASRAKARLEMEGHLWKPVDPATPPADPPAEVETTEPEAPAGDEKTGSDSPGSDGE